jgi:hypothetical protein
MAGTTARKYDYIMQEDFLRQTELFKNLYCYESLDNVTVFNPTSLKDMCILKTIQCSIRSSEVLGEDIFNFLKKYIKFNIKVCMSVGEAKQRPDYFEKRIIQLRQYNPKWYTKKHNHFVPKINSLGQWYPAKCYNYGLHVHIIELSHFNIEMLKYDCFDIIFII